MEIYNTREHKAIQYTGTNLQELRKFVGKYARLGFVNVNPYTHEVLVHTYFSHHGFPVRPKDWLVYNGSVIYYVTNKQFKEHYEYR